MGESALCYMIHAGKIKSGWIMLFHLLPDPERGARLRLKQAA